MTSRILIFLQNTQNWEVKLISSTTGKTLVITVGGGSHEPEMTLKMSGLPKEYIIRGKRILDSLNRRAPGSGPLSTSRKESDIPLLKYGDSLMAIEEDTIIAIPSSGTLEFVIKNKNYNSKEYNLKLPRPGHADLPAFIKYGDSVNMAGGGPFSGRMTAMLTLAGAVAAEILSYHDIHIGSSIYSIGHCKSVHVDPLNPIDAGLTDEMRKEIMKVKETGDSLGGVVEGFATGIPVGIGGPLFHGMESNLANLLFGIPAIKGVEFGKGFKAAEMRGSDNNDNILDFNKEKIVTETNNSGGILGGISTGMPIILRVAFKPTPSIAKPQKTVNVVSGENEILEIHGRHDPCIIPRGQVVVEAAMAVGILDMMLKSDEIEPFESVEEERRKAAFSGNNHLYISGTLPHKTQKKNDEKYKPHHLEHGGSFSGGGEANSHETATVAIPDSITFKTGYGQVVHASLKDDGIISVKGLSELRDEIDKIDDQILTLLDQRMNIARQVAAYKKTNEMDVKDSNREDKILEKVGDKYKDIYREIFKVSRKLQKKITNGKK